MSLPEPGKPFGPYAVEMPIGQGGMGAVYRARDPRLGRTVALKVMLPSEAGDPESRARFTREGRLAAALEHPGIVRIYEVGEFEGTPYIAMEWLEGKPLRRAKVERPVEVLTAIAETLAHAHDKGVIHRDLKPGNVMVDADGRPKLVDFGIAKRVVGAGTFATRDGVVLGTPSYMAPEQELSSAVDARADQYAWAVLAYELLTGDRPTKPPLAHAALDDRQNAVLLRALSAAPADRFPSMRELLAAWRDPPKETPVATAPAATMRLFFAIAATVTALGCVGLAVAMIAKPAPTASVVDAAVDATLVSTPLVIEAEADAASDAMAEIVEDASVEDAAVTKPRPKPAVPVSRGLSRAIMTGSAFVDWDELGPQLKEIRPALARCVTGLVLGPNTSYDAIVARVELRPNGKINVDWELSIWGSAHGGDPNYGGMWPPDSAKACIRPLYEKIRIHPTTPGEQAFFNIRLELKR